jgi:hypothetical protein
MKEAERKTTLAGNLNSVLYNVPCVHGGGLLNQRYKDMVFWGIAKATLPNHLARRYLAGFRASNGPRHLHLGCGPKYLQGFVNIDANPFNKIDSAGC